MIRKNVARSLPKQEVSVEVKSAQIKYVFITLGVIIVLLVIGIYSGLITPRPKKAAKVDVAGLVGKVGQHILIKQGEEPTVATIQDPQELKAKNPAFYQYAKAGDKLLIWSDKAVLYSEEQDLILAVLPIDILAQLQQTQLSQPSQPTPAPTAQPSSEEPATSTQPAEEKAQIEVRNGTLTAGLAKNMADKLTAAGFETLRPRDAGKKGYEKTLIIKLSDKPLDQTLAKLVDLTGGTVAELPESETNPKGDIMAIVGENYTP